MNFYKKNGRWADEERAVVNKIKRLIEEKGTPLHEIPDCHSLDELLDLQQTLSETITPIEQETSEIIGNEDQTEHFEEEIIADKSKNELPQDTEATEPSDASETIEDEKLNLGNDEEIESENQDEESKEQDSPIDAEQSESESDFPEYDPFAEEIIERSYNTGSASKTDKVEALNNDEPELEESTGTPVDNINPSTKKRAAEQTADALLKGYAKFAPIPFKWLSKIDEEKIEKLALDGQIDIAIEVSEGMTFDDYMKQTNAQVDEVFEIEEDTLVEIREPLIEVLMEQELELTPQQRLVMAVVSHLVQMLTVALKLRKQNNRILEFQKKMTGINGLNIAS